MTLHELQGKFEAITARTCSRSTWIQYGEVLTRFFEMFPEKKKPEDFLRADIADYLTLRKRFKKLSNSTLNHEIAILRAFWNWLISLGITEWNPASLVPLLPANLPAHTRQAQSAEQRGRLLSACNSLREHAMVLLGPTTGLPLSELECLRVPDYAPSTGLLTLAHSPSKTRRGLVLQLTKDVQQVLNLLIPPNASSDKRILASSQTLAKEFRQLCQRAGLQTRSYTSLTMCFANEMRLRGIDPITLTRRERVSVDSSEILAAVGSPVESPEPEPRPVQPALSPPLPVGTGQENGEEYKAPYRAPEHPDTVYVSTHSA